MIPIILIMAQQKLAAAAAAPPFVTPPLAPPGQSPWNQTRFQHLISPALLPTASRGAGLHVSAPTDISQSAAQASPAWAATKRIVGVVIALASATLFVSPIPANSFRPSYSGIDNASTLFLLHRSARGIGRANSIREIIGKGRGSADLAGRAPPDIGDK
jgi:hypothetical protein